MVVTMSPRVPQKKAEIPTEKYPLRVADDIISIPPPILYKNIFSKNLEYLFKL